MQSDGLEQFRRQVAAAAESASRILKPFYEQQDRLIAQLKPALDAQRRLAEAARPAVQRMAEAMAPIARQVQQMQDVLAPVLEKLQRAFQELPEKQRRALKMLAEDGWYFDPDWDFAQLFSVARQIGTGDIDEAREAFCLHFESRAPEIETELAERFPQREGIIVAALRAHQKEEYALSVPVFLAQADGICADLVGVQLYSRRDGAPQIASCPHIKNASPFEASLLYPLTIPTPITASKGERAASTDLLSRHAVLHGESTTYDTRVNSNRALSLLVYVAWVLEMVQEPDVGGPDAR